MKDNQFLPVYEAMRQAMPRFIKKPEDYLHYLNLLYNADYLDKEILEGLIQDFDKKAKKRISALQWLGTPSPIRPYFQDDLFYTLESGKKLSATADGYAARNGNATANFGGSLKVRYRYDLADIFLVALDIYLKLTGENLGLYAVAGKAAKFLSYPALKNDLNWMYENLIDPAYQSVYTIQTDEYDLMKTMIARTFGIEMARQFFDSAHKPDISWIRNLSLDDSDFVKQEIFNYQQQWKDLIDRKKLIKDPELRKELIRVFSIQ